MFGKMMNNYYYGKSGKGDFRKDDMPETRMQLFWDTLRTRLSGLCRLNLLYMLVWLPAMIVVLLNVSSLWNRLQTEAAIEEYEYTEYAELLQSRDMTLSISEEEYNKLFCNPYQAAQKGYIEDVIEPRNTRFRVIRALETLSCKQQEVPAKKHDNLPL